jgi:hypothetical protein
MSWVNSTRKNVLAWKRRALVRIPRLQLWLIHRSDERELRVLKEKFYPLMEVARKVKDEKEEASRYSEYAYERDMVLHPTYGLVATMLEKKARKLGIRVPDKRTGNEEKDEENWEQSHYTGDWMLTPEAERKLRNEIRGEERAQADESRKWLTLFFVLLGTLFAFMSYRTKQKQPDLCPINYYRNDSGACVFARPVRDLLPQPALPVPKPTNVPPIKKKP